MCLLLPLLLRITLFIYQLVSSKENGTHTPTVTESQLPMSSALFREYLKDTFVMTSGDHHLYAIPISMLATMDIRTWSRNRPADEGRVAEIRNHHLASGHVDGTIRLAFTRGEGLVCYEGNHRRLALTDNIEKVLVDILWDVPQERIIEEFRLINKAVPVSELYTELDMDSAARHNIEEFVRGWCVKYRAFVSASARPNRPQFNRDMFTQELVRVWTELGRPPAGDLLSAVESVNTAYGQEQLGFHKTAIKSERTLHKCAEGGLWLFALSGTLSKSHIEGFMV
jgi:hypothetical protein